MRFRIGTLSGWPFELPTNIPGTSSQMLTRILDLELGPSSPLRKIVWPLHLK